MSAAPPDTYTFSDDGLIPNHPYLPVLLYHGIGPAAAGPAACEHLFATHGWGRAWRDGIYSFHHYHSTAHEVLGIVSGQARVQLGGSRGRTVELVAGDVVVLPAGTGHCNLGASADLLVVGAYPPGPRWDLCRGEPGERPAALARILAVPLPTTDPVAGLTGPLLSHWRRPDQADRLR